MVNKNLHHVVVTLTEATKKSAVNDDTTHDPDVKVLDARTILVRLTNTSKDNIMLPPRYYRQLEFDAVGFEYEPHIRTEISAIMDHLFKCKENCSMIRVAPQRTMNMNLLTRFLVAEVDKAMLALRCRMTSIHLEYYDIRKFDMINMLPLVANNNFSPTTNVSQNNGKGKRRKRPSYSVQHKTMQSTRELFQWLLTEYTLLRAHGTGDDYIDVEFQFNDSDQKKHIVHFSLFQIFAIAADSRSDLMRFFKSIDSGKNPQPTLITDCLKESFDLESKARTLLWFEVPLNRESQMWVKNMFKLADTAYVNISLARMEKEDKEIKELEHLAKVDSQKSLNKFNVLKSLSQTSNSSNASKRSVKSGSKTTPSSLVRSRNSVAPASAKSKYDSSFYCNDDYNTLSYWYNRVDEVIIMVYQAMDLYYSELYRNKARRICEEIKLIGNEESGGDNNGPNNTQLTAGEEQARMRYTAALAQFRRLDQEVEKSSYSATLKVYLSTKSYELTQAEEKHKQKELANLRSSVIDYVRCESMIVS